MDYKAVFRAVLELAPSLAPEEMVTDFEEAIWRAAAHAQPDVAVRGCNFHFSQALLRQVSELGLKRAYCKQGVVQDYIKLLFALPYLPKEHIRPTFYRIAEGANDALKPLITYVEKQWFHKFTPEDWCVYRHTLRTNNDVEGWHNPPFPGPTGSRLRFPNPHPTPAFPGTYGFPAKVLRTPAFPGTYGFPAKAPPPHPTPPPSPWYVYFQYNTKQYLCNVSFNFELEHNLIYQIKCCLVCNCRRLLSTPLTVHEIYTSIFILSCYYIYNISAAINRCSLA